MTSEEKKYLENVKLRDKRRAHIVEFALALLQQCKDENLSIGELDSVITIIKQEVSKTTLHDGLTL